MAAGGLSRSIAGLSLLLAGCLIGQHPDFQADSGEATGTESEDSAESDTGEDCSSGCTNPPGPCFEPQGVCADGKCAYTPTDAGTDCSDECATKASCDGSGSCMVDEGLDCSPAHASGECIDGECSDYQCDDGWSNCNGDWEDGCEVDGQCGGDCGDCDDVAHAMTECVDGQCMRTCEDPWQNCNEDWNDGCEVPVGIAHACSQDGIVDDGSGCWTAYCGQMDDPDATNFDGYYCYDCSTCRVPAETECQWCNHETGEWYPAEVCPCGEYEDLVCKP